MATILLQTTIAENPDDWEVRRFSMLAGELRADGHDVLARNRVDHGAQDPVLSHLDELGFDQLWLMGVDVGDGLMPDECAAIGRFRGLGGGVLTARDHRDLGCCLRGLGSLGQVNEFDDVDRDYSRHSFHSGANGDYQPVLADAPVHQLLRTARTATGRIEWFPAHPHEGAVSARVPFATAVAQGRSTVTGRQFNLAVALDGERTPDGRPMGRAVAESSFHHFADYNWDLDCGAPSFVTDRPGWQIKADPSRLGVFKDYVRNLATWLQPPDRYWR